MRGSSPIVLVDTLKDYSTKLQFCVFLGLKFSTNIIFRIKISTPTIIVYQWIENNEKITQIHGFPIEHSWVATTATYIKTNKNVVTIHCHLYLGAFLPLWAWRQSQNLIFSQHTLHLGGCFQAREETITNSKHAWHRHQNIHVNCIVCVHHLTTQIKNINMHGLIFSLIYAENSIMHWEHPVKSSLPSIIFRIKMDKMDIC